MKHKMYGPAKLSAILLAWSLTGPPLRRNALCLTVRRLVFPFDAWSNAATIGQARSGHQR